MVPKQTFLVLIGSIWHLLILDPASSDLWLVYQVVDITLSYPDW